MKHLKIYENYQTEEQVAKICEKYDIINWTLNKDGLVDVDGDVFLNFRRLKKLPLKFGTVTGDFYCNNNELTTLEGAPQSVSGVFFCINNPLPLLIRRNMKHIKYIISNQEMYHIYNKDGSINKYRLQLMMDSINESFNI